MRLIDAEKLRHELIMGHDLVGAKYTDFAETVKAIPIEWIKEHYGWLTMAGEIIKDWEAERGADK